MARVRIEYDMIEKPMRFGADVSEFRDMDADEIEQKIRELVDADACANMSFYPENISATVKDIQAALVLEVEDIDQ